MSKVYDVGLNVALVVFLVLKVAGNEEFDVAVAYEGGIDVAVV